MILITGATGFVGGAIVNRLIEDGAGSKTLAVCRNADHSIPSMVRSVEAGDLVGVKNLSSILKGVRTVVHCAARVHMMNQDSNSFLDDFRSVNVGVTLNLARQSVCCGVKRFIFLSTAKVNGEYTDDNQCFTAYDHPAPVGAYAISKFEAETALREIGDKTGMEVVIIRPPLVYGPKVRANFKVMVDWISSGRPLPLGAIKKNKRSFVALDNLVDLIVTCINYPADINQTFMVSDNEDLSTAELLKRIGIAVGRPPRLINVPTSLLRLGALLFNRGDVYQRLCSSFQLDISHTKNFLGWRPLISVDQGLRAILRDTKI